MNVRQVAFLLFASVGLWSISATADAQQLQIRGPKSNTAELSGTTYGPVVPEDTLWRIASRYRQNKNLSVYQVMQAIYQLNPDAFEDENFNHLVDGSILKLPSERYVARIDPKVAQMKAEQDDNAWRAFSKGETEKVVVKTSKEAASKDDLTETKQVIEEKLSALDAEQNRQFTAIRQQFAESIESVQTLLNENRKLVDRLDTVDTEISSLRGRVDEELQVQMDQMLALQNELLAISREAETQRKAEMENKGFAWLTDPLFLILLSVLLTISLLGAFAMWLIRRKRPEANSDAILDENHAAILEQSDEMDDLADALTNELSEELEDSDDDLFGDDDLLDDVLSEELEESLDADSDDNFEAFDDLDDESLDPVIEDATDEVVKDDSADEEDDLDSLFDEEDLLADIGDELDESDADTEQDALKEEKNAQPSEDDESGLLESDPIEAVEDEIADLDIDIAEDKVDETESTADDAEINTESQSPVISAPAIDDEPDKPEISIDELLEPPQSEEDADSIISDNPDLMNEEMLQSIDKEIHQQNAHLDNITDELLNEIEQLEQMGGMLEEDPESLEEPEPTESQMGIQELDSLSEDLFDVVDDDEKTDEINDDLEQPAESQASESVEPSQLVDEQDNLDVDDIDDLLNQQSVEDSSVETLSADELLAELESDKQQQTEELAEPDLEGSEEALAEPDLEEAAEALAEPDLEEAEDTLAEPDIEEAADALAESDLEEAAEALAEPELEEPEETLEESDLEEAAETLAEPDLDEVEDTLAESDLEEPAEALAEPELEEAEDALAEPDQEEDDLSAEQAPQRDTEQNENDDIEDLDKALDEFEQEVLAEATSFDVELGDDSAAAPSDDLDDMQLEQIIPNDKDDDIEKVLSDFDEEIPSIDDIDSLTGEDSDGFDDADLDEALKAFDESYLGDQDKPTDGQTSEQPDNVELDDLPGLGDWLSSEEAAETSSLDELENTSFDELLDSIDEVDDETQEETNTKETTDNLDSGLDFDALLNDIDDTPETSAKQKSEDDFLDVDDLINESIEAEGNLDIDKDLNLAAAFESYKGLGDADEVDVDSDHGIGAKLDLAQAYIETDDIESAKELLEEVLQNGDETQQEEAKELLEKLA